MPLFRKKPVEIEARQYKDIASASEIIDWALSHDVTVNYWCPNDEACRAPVDGHLLRIPTLEGNMDATLGDWIIKGVNGEFYPCKPDIFNKTYDACGRE